MKQALADVAAWLLSGLYTVLTWALDGVVYALKSTLWLFVRGLLDSASALVNAISVADMVFQWSAGWAGVPSQAVYVLSAIGFPECVAMISAAIAIRVALNFIPSWATRA